MKAHKPDIGGNGSQQLRSTADASPGLDRSGDAVGGTDMQNENLGIAIDDDTMPDLVGDSDNDVPSNKVRQEEIKVRCHSICN